MARQGELLEKPKRTTRGQLMHVCDAGDADGLIVQMSCKKCNHQTKWFHMPTVTEAKRGLPCPKCNAQTIGYGGHMIPYREFTDVDAMIKAAEQADKDGDYEHAKQLRSRAKALRRSNREDAFGVPSIWS